MFKAMILLTRRGDMTHEEFRQWWIGDHAPLARQLPGVRKIRFNEVIEGDGIDGVAELWFDNRESFESAYSTDIGRSVAQDSLDHVQSRVRLFVDEHQILDT